MTQAPNILDPAPAGAPRVAVVVSRYNEWITERLLEGAAEAFARRAGGEGVLDVARVPGAFELPAAAGAAARSGRYDAVVALACLIRGETAHDRHIASAVATSLASLGAELGLPVAFGVLTTETPEQAEARAGGAHGNKGAEAMDAALDTIGACRALAGGARGGGGGGAT